MSHPPFLTSLSRLSPSTLILALILTASACSDSGVKVAPQTTNQSGGQTTTGTTDNSGGNGDTGGGTTEGDSGASTAGDSGGNTTNGDTGGDTGGSTDGNTDPANPGASGNANLDPAFTAAARFLTQATFGPTESTINQLAADNNNYDAWIEQQIAVTPSLTYPYTLANSNGSRREARHEIWWENAISAPDQLRQRVAFALSQLFVVSDLDFALGNAQYGMSDYYDMLITNAFSNYREILERVTLHPVMGVYLSMVRNEKANVALNIRPDENYAREVLQLFSIGLYQLNSRGEAIPASNPEPAYTQRNIEEFARVFTGWNYPNVRSWTDTNLTNPAYQGSMVPVEEFHDNGSKVLLNNAVVPAGQTVAQDMQSALDNIFNHSNTGPFIAKAMIKRLVTSNPSPDYVERVGNSFNDNGNGVRGDMRAVIKAVLLDDEARTGHLNNLDSGKVREPVIKLAHFFRALNGTPGPESGGVHSTANFPMVRINEMTGQAVMKSQSVFNFFLPEFALSPGSDITAPEMQILTESNTGATHNNYHHQIYRFHNRADLNDDNPRVTIIQLEELATLAANPGNLADWIDLVFFSGDMPSDMRATLINHMNTISNNDSGRFARVQDALFLTMVSPALNQQR